MMQFEDLIRRLQGQNCFLDKKYNTQIILNIDIDSMPPKKAALEQIANARKEVEQVRDCRKEYRVMMINETFLVEKGEWGS